jgi:hypothetical protein
LLDYAGERSPFLREGLHGHPLDTIFRRSRPRTIKECFYWAEVLLQHSPHVYAVVRKFGEYPLTKLKFGDVGVAERQRHRELYDDHLRAREFAGVMSFDAWVYGNAAASLYEPFKRMLCCPRCRAETDIVAVEDYDFSLEKLTIKYDCPRCRNAVRAQIKDIPLVDARRLNLTRWDPKLLDIKHNPLTNQSVYYFQIPQDLRQDIRAGDQHLINTMPMSILKTVQKGKLLRFNEGNLYHMKMPNLSGLRPEWGLPPVAAAIEMFLFAAALRRGNEAVALEHITPMRVIHPTGQGVAGDPSMSLDLDGFREKMEQGFRDFKRDPNKIIISPVPVGVQDIGGQGRAMLTFAELEAAEKNIMLAFGVPREFLEGGLGQTRGETTLRMIENQLQNHINNLNGLFRWIELKTAKFLGTTPIDVRLSDFKMIDDTARKELMLQLWGQGKISDTTIYEMFEIDADHERKQRRQDTIDDLREQQILEFEVNKIQTSLSQRARQQSQASGPIDYNNTDQVMGAADQKAQEYMQMDEAARTNAVDNLQGSQPILHAVVMQRIQQIQQNQEAEARSSMQGGAAQGGMQ